MVRIVNRNDPIWFTILKVLGFVLVLLAIVVTVAFCGVRALENNRSTVDEGGPGQDLGGGIEPTPTIPPTYPAPTSTPVPTATHSPTTTAPPPVIVHPTQTVCPKESMFLAVQGQKVDEHRFGASHLAAPDGWAGIIFDGQLEFQGPHVIMLLDPVVIEEIIYVQGTWYAICPPDMEAIAARMAATKLDLRPGTEIQIIDRRAGRNQRLN